MRTETNYTKHWHIVGIAFYLYLMCRKVWWTLIAWAKCSSNGWNTCIINCEFVFFLFLFWFFNVYKRKVYNIMFTKLNSRLVYRQSRFRRKNHSGLVNSKSTWMLSTCYHLYDDQPIWLKFTRTENLIQFWRHIHKPTSRHQ